MRRLTLALLTIAIASPALAQLPSRTNGMGSDDAYVPGQPLVPYRTAPTGGTETYGPNGLHLRAWDDMGGTETYDDDEPSNGQPRNCSARIASCASGDARDQQLQP